MGDVGRPFRPIAPRMMPPGGGPGGEKPPGGGAGVPPEEGKMKRASTACKECQKRRTRCTGMPCTECVTHNRECITDELSDKRRKASAKKTQEELIEKREFLDLIFTLLRNCDATSIQHFIQTVRSGVQSDEIRSTVEQILSTQMHHQSHPQSAAQSSVLNPQHPHHSMDPNIMDPNMRPFFDPHSQ